MKCQSCKAKWRTFPRENRYEVSTCGCARNAATLRHLAPRQLKAGGYLRFQFGAGLEEYAHRAVLETFVGPSPSGFHASHLNGNKQDNRLSNLAWEDPATNNRRKIDHGTAMFGERNVQGRKTHCPRGHAYDDENTRHSNGKRVCRACCRERIAQIRAKRRGRSKLTGQQWFGAIRRVRNGQSVASVAKRIGVSVPSLQRRVDEFNAGKRYI